VADHPTTGQEEEAKHYGVTGDLLDQPILADLPGVRAYV
jgi:hypothetical protein